MGAPKQKWTSEEESALKAGIVKHGAGKWRTILKDPEFANVLYMRSNVDLKDKWRNMSVMANGWGSRDKSRGGTRRLHHSIKHEEASSSSDVPQSDQETIDVKPTALSSVSSDPVPEASPKRSIMRLDKLILEAITYLKEPNGSNKTAITSYIEDQYWAPPDFKRLLSEKLNLLLSSGQLIRVKHNYRIVPSPAISEQRRNPVSTLQDGRQFAPHFDGNGVNTLTKSQIDTELAKMRKMTPEEAAAVAARAVAEAEAAIAEAEEAAREAEEAEADADKAQAFAEAAMLTLRGRSTPKMQMVRAAI